MSVWVSRLKKPPRSRKSSSSKGSSPITARTRRTSQQKRLQRYVASQKRRACRCRRNHVAGIPKTTRRKPTKPSGQPTLNRQEAGEDERQRQLYDMIWKRAVASQLADAEYSVTRLRLTSTSGSDSFSFNATGRVLTSQGWRVLTPKDAAEDAEEPDDSDGSVTGGAVPALPIDSTVTASSARVTDKQTKAPNAYTQASLIKKLETEGIGRPSTYPETLKKIIVTRKYVDEAKRKLAPTELGKLLAASLIGNFSFADYAYTRDLEEHLDNIATGKASYAQVLSNLDSKLNSEIEALHLTPHRKAPVHTQPRGRKPNSPATRAQNAKRAPYASRMARSSTAAVATRMAARTRSAPG